MLVEKNPASEIPRITPALLRLDAEAIYMNLTRPWAAHFQLKKPWVFGMFLLMKPWSAHRNMMKYGFFWWEKTYKYQVILEVFGWKKKTPKMGQPWSNHRELDWGTGPTSGKKSFFSIKTILRTIQNTYQTSHILGVLEFWRILKSPFLHTYKYINKSF